MTETKLNELKINYLTEAQYKEAKTNGAINDDELYMTPDNSDTIFDLVYPVGSYYETSDTSFDPNVTWGGTWELEVDGTVLVSKSTVSGSKFNVVVGTVIGEETHKLTVNEMPSHTHLYRASIGAGNAEGSLNFGSQSGSVITGQWGNAMQSSGGSQPHNNVQPSKVVNRWHRTA